MDQGVKIGVSNDAVSAQVQAPESISISRPPMPSSAALRVEGINLLNQIYTIEDIRAKLRAMGIELGKILYFVYSDGTMGAALFYCKTVHGQYVLVEAPLNTKVTEGDLSINIQRVGVLPSNIISTYATLLKDIYTGYAFLAAGGIHLVKKGQLEPLVYGYDNYPSAQQLFDIKKHHYIILPLVSFGQLVEPTRLNTIEAFVNMQDRGLLKAAVEKAGLGTFLTMSGPFTVFFPTDERLQDLIRQDPERLRSILLAGIISGRLDSLSDTTKNGKINGSATLTDVNKVATLGSESIPVKALGGNDLIVSMINGVVISVTAGGKAYKVKPGKPIKKYNGVLYRIDAVFAPTAYSFQMPPRSDFDDVVTVFDINRSTLEIRRAQYDLNLKEQQIMVDLLHHINQISGSLMRELVTKATYDGKGLIDSSNKLMELFYSQEVPCGDQCLELDGLAGEVAHRNEEYERVMRVSTRLASLRVPLEEMYLKLARTNQRFHVPDAIGHVSKHQDE